MHVSNETHSSRLQCKESKNILLLRMAGVSMTTSHGKQPVNFVYQPTVTQTTGEDWIENLYFESAITENLSGSVHVRCNILSNLPVRDHVSTARV